MGRDVGYKIKYGVPAFEQFVDVFLKELLEKVNTALPIQTNSIEVRFCLSSKS